MQRLKYTGTFLILLPFLTFGTAATIAGLYFLGNWLYSIDLWWLGVIARIFQWAAIVGLVLMIIALAYTLIRMLITGKMGDD